MRFQYPAKLRRLESLEQHLKGRKAGFSAGTFCQWISLGWKNRKPLQPYKYILIYIILYISLYILSKSLKTLPWCLILERRLHAIHPDWTWNPPARIYGRCFWAARMSLPGGCHCQGSNQNQRPLWQFAAAWGCSAAKKTRDTLELDPVEMAAVHK